MGGLLFNLYYALFPLRFLRSNTDPLGPADHDGFFEEVGSRRADVRTGGYHLSGFEFHDSGSVPNFGDFTGGFNVITGVGGSQEFYFLIAEEKSFVTVAFDQQFRSHISEKVDHMGAIHQASAVMGILVRHS